MDTGREIFASCSFSSLGLHSSLCDALRENMGFDVPTMVQADVIPVTLSGRNVYCFVLFFLFFYFDCLFLTFTTKYPFVGMENFRLVNAETGTGKTIAYLAPIVHILLNYDPRIARSDGTFALVLVPTRELCIQVYEILRKLLHRFYWIVPGYVMGGENRMKEKARLRKGISILVATPGRLLDHLRNTSSFLHANLRLLIFDEADRILELGYGKDIEEILELVGSREKVNGCSGNEASKFHYSQRQNLLLSATLTEKVNCLAKISLKNPIMIGLEGMQTTSISSHTTDGESEHPGEIINSIVADYNLPAQLLQRYVRVSCGSRLPVLLSILKNLTERKASKKIVVFFSTCDAVDFHYSLLKQFQWPTVSGPEGLRNAGRFMSSDIFRLHGNLKQDERKKTLEGFKGAKSSVLLCTDVAARGLDIPKVRSIIQYDCAGEATEYVHRVGRTARLGERGTAVLFLQPVEIDYLHDLEKHGVMPSEYPLLKVLNSFPFHGGRHFPQKFVSMEMHPLVQSLQLAVESFVSAEASMKKLAKEGFCSWVRAYTAHRGDLKRIFSVKKVHLGHVAKSFGLKEQPSLVGSTFRHRMKKRKRDQKRVGVSRKRRKNSS